MSFAELRSARRRAMIGATAAALTTAGLALSAGPASADRIGLWLGASGSYVPGVESPVSVGGTVCPIVGSPFGDDSVVPVRTCTRTSGYGTDIVGVDAGLAGPALGYTAVTSTP